MNIKLTSFNKLGQNAIYQSTARLLLRRPVSCAQDAPDPWQDLRGGSMREVTVDSKTIPKRVLWKKSIQETK